MSFDVDFLPTVIGLQTDDMLLKIERAFNVKLQPEALADTASLDALCDVVYNALKSSAAEGCSTQQAFYKFRNAYMSVAPCSKSEITPACKVKSIFPPENRLQMVEQVEFQLGLKINILQPNAWILTGLVAAAMLSIVACFVFGPIGLIGLAGVAAGYKFSARFCSALNVNTVGDLVAKLIRDNQLKTRRNQPAISRSDIETKLRTLFAEQLQMEPALA